MTCLPNFLSSYISIAIIAFLLLYYKPTALPRVMLNVSICCFVVICAKYTLKIPMHKSGFNAYACPSGHMVFIIALYGSAFYEMLKKKLYIIPVIFSISIYEAIVILCNDYHVPRDIYCGFITGVVSLVAAYKISSTSIPRRSFITSAIYLIYYITYSNLNERTSILIKMESTILYCWIPITILAGVTSIIINRISLYNKDSSS